MEIVFYPDGSVLKNDSGRRSVRDLSKFTGDAFMYSDGVINNIQTDHPVWRVWNHIVPAWTLISASEVPNEIRLKLLLTKD